MLHSRDMEFEKELFIEYTPFRYTIILQSPGSDPGSSVPPGLILVVVMVRLWGGKCGCVLIGSWLLCVIMSPWPAVKNLFVL